MRLRIAAAQMAVTDTVARNQEALGRALEYAASEGADILLTPEGSLSGYRPDFDVAEVETALQQVTRRAGDAGVGLALGTCFVEADGRCYNQIRLYGRDGGYRGFHSKTLTCGSLDEPHTGEINHYAVAPLRTFDWGGATLGALICNDLWANPGCTPQDDPHLTQRLAWMGAKVVLHAVNGGRDGSRWSEVNWAYHESNLLMRARAAGLWIVTVDNCRPEHLPCSSPSGVVTPRGEWACRAGDRGEAFFCHSIELEDEK